MVCPRPSSARLGRLLLAAGLLLTVSCTDAEEGALGVLWIGDEDALQMDGVQLSAGARHVRAATGAGLVALDERAEVIPALAERWIITEDGRSFIFRLREGSWPDGSEITSQSVQRALQRTIRALRGTALGLDLAQVEEIRAMTGRVVELRLSAPVPDLLRLLAQPELTITTPDGGTGPMVLEPDEDAAGDLAENGDEEAGNRATAAMVLRFRPPEERGLPEQPGWQNQVRDIVLETATPEAAVARFEAGTVGIVLGGRVEHLPLVDTGPLSRGTVRIDATIGLFGLLVRHDTGLLGDAGVREALAMALDRPELMARYNVGGWLPTTRIVSPILPGDPGYVTERWTDMTIEERRAIAAQRVSAWLRTPDANDGEGDDGNRSAARLTLALGDSPGFDPLFRDLAAQWATIGVELVRSDDPEAADLALIDRVARYADPLWFLNQFDCSFRAGPCNEDADYLLDLAREAIDPVERATLLAETEAELHRTNYFIPFGVPLRWSLVRSRIEGFAPNVFAFHPLPPLARLPR